MAKQKPKSRAAAKSSARKKSPSLRTATKSTAQKKLKSKGRAAPAAKRAQPRQRVAISHHPFVQSARVHQKVFELAVGTNSKAALTQLEQRALFCFGYSSAAGELANDFVIRFLPVTPERIAQSIRFSLKIAKLNSG